MWIKLPELVYSEGHVIRATFSVQLVSQIYAHWYRTVEIRLLNDILHPIELVYFA